MSVSTNIDDIFRDMDAFVAQAQQVAMPRALNELAKQATTAGLRAVNDIYKIGPRTMRAFIAISDASSRAPEAVIAAKGRALPMSAFRPLKTATGISVQIKGRRFVIPHSFRLRVSKWGGVIARGAYGGRGVARDAGTFGTFTFGRGRYPISTLYGPLPADFWNNDEVVAAMQGRVEEQAAKILQREIKAVTRGF